MVPVIGANVSPNPLADSVTAVPATALPLASSTVTVSAVVDVPFAVTEPGLVTMVDLVADGAPVAATNVTEVFSCALPSVAVMVSVSTPLQLDKKIPFCSRGPPHQPPSI